MIRLFSLRINDKEWKASHARAGAAGRTVMATAGQGRCWLTARSARFQPQARPLAPRGPENACPSGKIGRPFHQKSVQSGDVGRRDFPWPLGSGPPAGE